VKVIHLDNTSPSDCYLCPVLQQNIGS